MLCLPLSVLKKKASSHGLKTEGMWMTSIVNRYKNRPDGADFDDMCIASFASKYCVLSKCEHSANRITLKFVLCRTQTQFTAVWYMHVSLDVKDEGEVGRKKEAHYMTFLLLSLPYRANA